MSEDESEDRGGVQAVETGIRLLMALAARRGPQRLKQLAEDADMLSSKAHRYMVSFQRTGLVQQDERTSHYSLGPASLQLGLAALAGLDVVEIGLNSLRDLRDELGETVGLLVWGRSGPMYVKVEESDRPVSVNSRPGSVLPLLSSASGQIFLSYLPQDVTDPFVKRELAFNKRSGDPSQLSTMAAVRDLIALTRQRGLARVSGNYFPGIGALSSPVFDSRGDLAAAVTILGPQNALDLDFNGALARKLRSHTANLSKQMGFGLSRPA